MGLDMYMIGVEKSAHKNEEIAYWRKHPNLHGYIVNQFAGGKDDCQEIPLTVADLKQIVKAIEDEILPPTTGFFFGRSNGLEKESDLETMKKVIEWAEGGSDRIVVYQASW